MRLRSAFLVFAISCLPFFARADDASKLAKIQEFFKVAKYDQLSAQTMKTAMDQMNSGMVQQMFGVKLSADQQQKANDLSAKTQKIVMSALSWENLEPEYEKIYAAAYTEQQIDDILAFYKSPTGRAMVEKTPGLLQQASLIVQQRMASAIPQIQQLMKDYMAQQTTTTPQPTPKE